MASSLEAIGCSYSRCVGMIVYSCLLGYSWYVLLDGRRDGRTDEGTDDRTKGKERKGEGREGKGREGKERKGKERKGKERKGKERRKGKVTVNQWSSAVSP